MPTPAVDQLLTPRQLEVLELMAKGLTNREIAGVLGISAATVKAHVSAVIDALDVTNRTEAAVALGELRGESQSGGVPGFGSRPAIAVLPFDVMSDDPDQALFAEGLVEDLTTGLAAWRWFPVIARNTATALPRPVSIPEASRELGARYLVEGSTRRSGDQVRIHVQLIDGESGSHVFAQRYDRKLGDVFAVQDEIVTAVIGQLEPALLRVEGVRALRAPHAELEAWDHLQRGLALLGRDTPEEVDAALDAFDEAIAAAPEFAAAHAGLALAAQRRGIFWLGSLNLRPASNEETREARARARACFERSLAAGRRAVALDPMDAAGWVGLAHALQSTRSLDESIEAFERALELNPSSARACWGLAMALGNTERWDESGALLERAIRLSPRDPNLVHFEGGLAGFCLRVGDYDDALAHARRSHAAQRNDRVSYRPLIAAALGLLGRQAEASREVAELREKLPDWNLSLDRRISPPDLLELMLEGLRLAGWDLEA